MISAAVKELQAAKSKIASQIKGLEAEAKNISTAIAALSGLSAGGVAAPGKFKRSAATRAKMRKAQQARWAKIKGQARPAKKKRTMSAAARKAISLAVKARWAKQKAAAKKK